MNIVRSNYPVADAIMNIIKYKGLKQKIVAEKSGFSAQAFNDMLNGRKMIKACDIPKIAKSLDVQPNELFEIVPDDNPQRSA